MKTFLKILFTALVVWLLIKTLEIWGVDTGRAKDMAGRVWDEVKP
jgi:hypothetical protein